MHLLIILFIGSSLLVVMSIRKHGRLFQKAIVLPMSALLSLGILAGCSSSTELQDAIASAEELEEVVGEKDEMIEQLTIEVKELQEQMEDMESGVRDEIEAELKEKYEDEISELSELITENEKSLKKKNEKISELEGEINALQKEIEKASSTASSTNTTSSNDSCGPGTVKINSASETELQAIYQIGPERAAQIVSLRPFSSYSDMKRISGIGDKHAQAIEDQGIICFD
ncbi:ComEA family DNA-binding protein [Halalkalibacterium halodurans]|uniref:ComEA family DNA-binding protein n=1 Tax=Halalkalibacterium halodurans TaxID=86665 RepID=UPI002E24633C|nr:helix-hairpin-helix domain-containing protein [Halalkalibacterium halodurans]MED4223526.1 helix-hairpin-helix domain-containing protein [Halalkalibacterium halodurans]